MITESTRSLNDEELQLLESKIANIPSEQKREAKLSLGCFTTSTVFFLLTGVSFSSYKVTPFVCAVAIGAVLIYTFIDLIKSSRRYSISRQRLVEASRGAFVRVIEVQASRCFLVEGFDDEGDTYFFDVGDGRTLVMDNYGLDAEKFPCTEFTVAQISSSSIPLIDEIVTYRGKPLPPFLTLLYDDVSELPSTHMQMEETSLEDLLVKKGVGI